MKYPIYIGILIFLLVSDAAKGNIFHFEEESNLTVDCASFSGNISLDCIHKIPEIHPDFTDNLSNSNSDEIRFESLGGVVNDACNPVVIIAEDVIVGDDPADCMDPFTVIRTYRISDLVTEITCVTTYDIIYAPLQVLAFAGPEIVDCSENVDSLFSEWLDNFGNTELQGCGNIISINPSPIIAFRNDCLNDINSAPNQRGVVRILWELEDVCGVRAGPIASFVVVDNTPPTITCPNNQNFNIENPDLFSDIQNYLSTAMTFEQCGNARLDNNFIESDVVFDCQEIQQIPVVITARDTCDNTSNCQLNINIINQTLANIDCPNDIIIECGDANNLNIINRWIDEALATDFRNSDLTVENNFDFQLLNSPFCGQSTEITFSTTYCGRQSSCFTFVTIVDNKNPTISCPSDTTFFSTDSDIITNASLWLAQFSAIDDCRIAIEDNDLDNNDIVFSCDQTRDVAVNFFATDICQNDTSCVATITIVNDYRLEISCASSLDIRCGDINNMSVIADWLLTSTANDNINSNIIVESDLSVFDPRLATCNGIIPVNFTAEDVCGGQLSCVSFIMVSDDEPPVIIDCPADITFDDSVTDLNMGIENWLSSIVATDNCGISTVDNDFEFSSIQGCALSVSELVTFSATDICGSQAPTCTSRLTINTDRLPSIDCANSLLINCNDVDNNNLINNWLLTTTGMDFNGNNLTASHNFMLGSLDFNQCLDSMEVKFKIIDSCLYEDSCIATIIVADTIAPSINCPTSLSMSSTEESPLLIIENWLSLSFSDEQCMPGVLTHDFEFNNFSLCAADSIIEVTFSVIDGCNNSSSCSSNIIIDKSAPTVSCPNNELILECGNLNNDMIVQSWLSQATGLSNSADSLVVSSDYNPQTINSDCTNSTLVTFESQDICGLISNCSQNITIVDDEGPQFDCPSQLNLSTGATDIEQDIEEFFNNILIEDCNAYEVSDDLDRSLLDFTCGDELIIPVIFTAIDSCNNSTNCSFEIAILNTTVSSINCAQDTIIECGFMDNEFNIMNWLQTSTAFDNLNNEFIVTNDFSFNDARLLSCADEIQVIFTMVDNCNSSLSCDASITIRDTTAPSIDCPSDSTFTFGSPTFDSDIMNWLSSTIANDNCAIVTINDNFNNDFVLDDCLGFVDIIVNFTAQDDCGLTTECNSTLTISSERSSTINCPNDLNVECGNDDNVSLIDSWRLSAQGFDFDGAVLFASSEEYSELDFINLDCNDSLSVTFLITNSCGIDISCNSFIILDDTTPPELTCPEDITLNSTDTNSQDIITMWLNSAISTDNCRRIPTVTFDVNLDFSDLCQLPNVIEVTYNSLDDCGLSSSCFANISINKGIPIITCPEEVLTLECGNENIDSDIINWLSTVSASDNSGSNLLVTNDFMTIDISDVCVTDNDITFSVLDRCDQVVSCSQRITIIDSQPPTINCPSDVQINIFSDRISIEVESWLESIEGNDLCSNATTNDNFLADLNILNCGDAFGVIFSAEDECNNIAECEANISFISNQSVSILCPPTLTIKCSEVLISSLLDSFLLDYEVVSEGAFQVTTDFIRESIGGGCIERFSQAVSFTVSDVCNNTDICQSQIDLVPDAFIYIPNTFSPNGDGDNDWFTIYSNESVIEVKSMQIFDRWGNLVYEDENFLPNAEREGWDGSYNNKLVNSNVFVYKVEVEDVFGNAFFHTGSITIIK